MNIFSKEVIKEHVVAGLRISNYYGNFHERSVSDLDIGILDSDKAISVHIEHSRKLDAREYAFLQCAVLHTTPDGQRRVRTCNLALQVADLAANVFRYADMDAVVCHLARECPTLPPLCHIQISSHSFQQCRN
jgi:protein transport protein SEC24